MAAHQDGTEPEVHVLQASKVPLQEDGTIYFHDGGESREAVEARVRDLTPDATVEYLEGPADYNGRGHEPLTYPALKVTRD